MPSHRSARRRGKGPARSGSPRMQPFPMGPLTPAARGRFAWRMTLLSGPLLSGHARLAGILGWPVGHSRSPRLHGLWLRRHGIDGAYVPLPVRPEAFATAVRGLADLGFRGANVTIPHKEAAFAVCDTVDAAAHRAGAVNTLVFRDGRSRARNTDGWGFLANCASTRRAGRRMHGPVVVLGAGGSARAIAAALLDAGCPASRWSTARRRGPRRWRGRWAGRSRSAECRRWRAPAMLVNTTSLGMRGSPAWWLDLAPLPAGAVVADIVYVPRETPLLAAARARGLAAVDGLGMLLHQARPGFEAWFGVTPEVDDELRPWSAGTSRRDEGRRPDRRHRHGQVDRRPIPSSACACRSSMPMPRCMRCRPGAAAPCAPIAAAFPGTVREGKVDRRSAAPGGARQAGGDAAAGAHRPPAGPRRRAPLPGRRPPPGGAPGGARHPAAVRDAGRGPLRPGGGGHRPRRGAALARAAPAGHDARSGCATSWPARCRTGRSAAAPTVLVHSGQSRHMAQRAIGKLVRELRA